MTEVHVMHYIKKRPPTLPFREVERHKVHTEYTQRGNGGRLLSFIPTTIWYIPSFYVVFTRCVTHSFMSSESFRQQIDSSSRCFKQIWKEAKVGREDKVGKVGR
jgi:hypothetical protein